MATYAEGTDDYRPWSLSGTAKPVVKIMTFRPTFEEFKDFNKYILHMEKHGAHHAGIAKVIPPPEWKARASGDYTDVKPLVIPSPITQLVYPDNKYNGILVSFNTLHKSMTVGEYEEKAMSERYATPPHDSMEDLEKKFWKSIKYQPAIYGADISGTVTDKDQDVWNIDHLGSCIDLIRQSDNSLKVEGVNTAYLYFGMWKTLFPWHTEDMDLYSINYLHYGAPKFWYAIPPAHGFRFERMAAGFFPSQAKACPAFLRHKMFLISPTYLQKYSIPFDKVTQEENEIIITFPFGYHAGFNTGYNCAESTNFASPRWVEYGKRAVSCSCERDMVKIEMDRFVKKFQPDRYNAWKAGLDRAPHPEDDQRKVSVPGKAGLTAHMAMRRHPIGVTGKNRGGLKRSNSLDNIAAAAGGRSKTKRAEAESDAEETAVAPKRVYRGAGRALERQNSKSATGTPVSAGRVSRAAIPDVVRRSLTSDMDELPLQSEPEQQIRCELSPEQMEELESKGLSQLVQQLLSHSVQLSSSGDRAQLRSQRRRTRAEQLTGQQLTLPLEGLWHEDGVELHLEMATNKETAGKYPYCDVCQLLLRDRPKQLPPTSLPISESLFSHLSSPSSQVSAETGSGAASILLQCSFCAVSVHKSCAGERGHGGRDWLCDRCEAADWQAHCLLCPLRGGYLKKTLNGSWVHLTCLMLAPAIFSDVRRREGIRLSLRALNSEVCELCKSSSGHCVTCDECSGTTFHVSCGVRTGAVLFVGDAARSLCWKHIQDRTKLLEEHEQHIPEGSRGLLIHTPCHLSRAVVVESRQHRVVASVRRSTGEVDWDVDVSELTLIGGKAASRVQLADRLHEGRVSRVTVLEQHSSYLYTLRSSDKSQKTLVVNRGWLVVV